MLNTDISLRQMAGVQKKCAPNSVKVSLGAGFYSAFFCAIVVADFWDLILVYLQSGA